MNKAYASQRKKIFCLARELGLDNELLHEYVHKLTGRESLKDLSTAEAANVIDGLSGNERTEPGMASYRQKNYIKGLAAELGWVYENNPNELDAKRLEDFILKFCKISHMRWFTSKMASQVIEALKSMNNRKNEVI